jgi:hypothetical protein
MMAKGTYGWRRVRDRIDREYAQPLDVEALARGAHMAAGHLSREFRCAYGQSPYGYLMARRIERSAAGMPPSKAGDQTGQESRSAGRGSAPSVTAMDITIPQTHHQELS